MKGNTITTGGNIPLPGQQRPSTIILTQTRRFGIDIGSYMNALRAAESIDFPQRAKLYDLFEDILMDPHLSSVINKRKVPYSVLLSSTGGVENRMRKSTSSCVLPGSCVSWVTRSTQYRKATLLCSSTATKRPDG